MGYVAERLTLEETLNTAPADIVTLQHWINLAALMQVNQPSLWAE